MKNQWIEQNGLYGLMGIYLKGDNMDVTRVKEMASKLEFDIARQLTRFEAETKVKISDFTMRSIDTTTMGGKEGHIINVEIEVEL